MAVTTERRGQTSGENEDREQGRCEQMSRREEEGLQSADVGPPVLGTCHLHKRCDGAAPDIQGSHSSPIPGTAPFRGPSVSTGSFPASSCHGALVTPHPVLLLPAELCQHWKEGQDPRVPMGQLRGPS